MRRLPLSLVGLAIIVLASLTLAVAPAGAITYGQPDTSNRYSNVGAMVVKSKRSGNYVSICSGTLISQTVFLTASHCTAALDARGYTEAFVSFDQQISNTAKRIPATWVTNPGYNQRQSDSGDIAVMILSVPANTVYPGITPAALPVAGQLDQLAEKGGLVGAKFLAAGYGLQEPEFGGGPPVFGDSDERFFAFSEYRALNPGYIRLSQNNAAGDSGTCYGDSGGPNFLLNPDGSIAFLAALTVTGDYMCIATNVDYRLDTESARAFLGEFVTLP